MSGAWEEVGTCGVDAGCLLLIDPCYLPERVWNTYLAHINTVLDKDGDRDGDLTGIGVDGGVLVATGYGDGSYAVEVRRDHNDRVVEVRVKFTEEDDE